MINLNKIAIGLAAVALASVAGAQEIHNWRSSSGEVVKSGTLRQHRHRHLKKHQPLRPRLHRLPHQHQHLRPWLPPLPPAK